MGTPDYAWVILEKLLNSQDIEVVAVFTQPDKYKGRKQVLTLPYIKQMLIEKKSKIKIYQPQTLKAKDVYESIKKLFPDYIVVAAYGQILPENILGIAPCINLHASLLPKYRGAGPIQSTILNQDKYGGVTAMLMSKGLDTGDILAYFVVAIEQNIMLEELFDKLSFVAASLTVKTLRNFSKINPIKQFDALSCYSKKIKKSDGLIDFNDSKEFYIKFRAFHPWPGVYLPNGLKVKKMEISKQTGNLKKGEIVAIKSEYITVSCIKGAVDLYIVQPDSKKQMRTREYILGKRLKVGDNIL